MPLSSAIVGRRSEPQDTDVDARWLMAFAAGVGDTDPRYVDTMRAGGIVGHPVFPVCVEWATGQAIAPPGPTGLTAAEGRRGVHYAHDLLLHRPVHAGTKVTTCSEVVGVIRHRAGAMMVTRIDATTDGEPLWTTWMSSLLRDVEVDGEDRPPADLPAAPSTESDDAVTRTAAVIVAANAAHVYTECARIWNPIHTDPAVARAAGLPAIILHGTATLALGVSRVLEMTGGEPEDVARIAGRFAAMVTMPNELTVAARPSGSAVHFEVHTQDGRTAVRDGLVLMRAR